MICQRCAKEKPDVHTCTPSDYVRKLEADSARLDYLDSNLKFKMGWRIGKAPAGNIVVSSVIQLSNSTTAIRDAIDAAMKEAKS